MSRQPGPVVGCGNEGGAAASILAVFVPEAGASRLDKVHPEGFGLDAPAVGRRLVGARRTCLVRWARWCAGGVLL